MAYVPITFDISEEVLAGIDRIAEICLQPREWLLLRALAGYLANEGADILASQKGREEIANGDFHDMDDVSEELEEIVRAP